MTLSEKDIELLQSLYLISSTRIYRLSSSRFSLIQSFPPRMKRPILPTISNEQSIILLKDGSGNYLLIHYKDELILFGPFFDFAKEQKHLRETISSFLFIFDGLFCTEFTKTFQCNEIMTIHSNMFSKKPMNSFLDEEKFLAYSLSLNDLIECVATGNPHLVIEKLNHIPLPPYANLPSLTYVEQNKILSIVYFVKLYNTCIKDGKDRYTVLLKLVDYIVKTYEASDIEIIRTLRREAILEATKFVTNHSNSAQGLGSSILNYINENLYSDITVKSLAKHFHVSEPHLRTVFKKQTNTTILKYINEKKINEAMKLLKYGYTISDIIKLLHFYDSSHFYRHFKKVAGYTPKEYVKILKEKERI